MRRLLFPVLGPLIGLLFFAGALWVIHIELKAHHVQDIFAQLTALKGSSIALALVLTTCNYLLMTGYDFLALRYIGRRLSAGKTALASFIGYAFANNLGFAMLTGASLRYRLYSGWGLSVFEITKIIAFCTITIWLGFFCLSGFVFLIEPLGIPAVFHLPFSSVRPLGIMFLLIVGGYILLSLIRRKPFRLGDREIILPPASLIMPQIGIAALDWTMAGGILFILLPEPLHLSFPAVLGIFLLAQVAGIASQIPGGLGVFEAVIIVLLSPEMPASAVAGSLLVYRGIYYLIPLMAAALLLAINELVLKRDELFKGARFLQRWISVIVPRALTVTTFTAGTILLFSGSTPAVHSRLNWLKDVLPLPVIEVSHFLGSIAGIGLLFLARGLQRRIDAAYILACLLLVAGIGFSLLKGLDYEEALILSLMLLALIPSHRYFTRKASLTADRFSPAWSAAIAAVLVAATWLVFFSYKHVEYSADLWWRFAISADAPRSLRALVGASVLGLWFFGSRLLRTAPVRSSGPGQEDLDRALPIIRRSPASYANLALLGDKRFLFNNSGTAFIMYGIEGPSWIAMGDPVGPADQRRELAWQFREMCDRSGVWPVFYEVSAETIPLYLELGLTLIKLGEEARVPLDAFSLEGSARKELRHTFNKMDKAGCTFEIVEPVDVRGLMPELRQISQAWLLEKNTGEKGYSLGFFQEDYLAHFPAGLVRTAGKITAFANIWQAAEHEELSVDLMRHLPDSPHGVMDYLFIQLMLWGKREGFSWFNLGMAPLSGLDDRSLAPLWNRTGSFIFRHAEYFYNFQGLRQYKDKFDPVWTPRYLASPGMIPLPVIFANIAALTSGGIKGIFAR